MGFTNPNDVQSDLYHTALLDIPSTRIARNNRCFHEQHNLAPKEQDEQPPSAVEARLNRIETRLDTIGAKISNIPTIL
ncbi:hypothetical protein J1N35_026660 [Gossypium stocksii]|uniref:Uncharacterized protein n=1 Tax=Gossypium stocksii TaxID=47602 RepID=A0A9D3V8Q0_9ROSI|nr:hypothetical protein J1N35_026660 [Gossypium stocksii]